jgi:hypothetical protein
MVWIAPFLLFSYLIYKMSLLYDKIEDLKDKVNDTKERLNKVAEQILYRNIDWDLSDLINEDNTKACEQGEAIAIYLVSTVLQKRQQEFFGDKSDKIISFSERVRVIESMLRRFKYFLKVEKLPSLVKAKETLQAIEKTSYTPVVQDETRIVNKILDDLTSGIIRDLNFYEILTPHERKEKYINPLLESQKQAKELINIL